VTFFNEPLDERVRPSVCIISGRQIVHDLRSGMTRRELMQKYGLSGEQLKKVFAIILRERRKIAEKIAADVRSGMKGSELMEKYQLSHSALQKVCQTLLTEGLLRPEEINGPEQPLIKGESVHHERRKASRRSSSLQILVSDRSNDALSGALKDITEKGLAVRGIEADIGELKTLAILGDEIGIIDPFELMAECRWVGSEGSEGQSVAGFQVTAISNQDLQRLQELIEFLDLGWSATL
jgi:Mor family transcriptional regulator